MTIAPNPLYGERMAQHYDQLHAPSIPGNKGPLSHEEGIASDTDRPNDFVRGAYIDTAAQPGTLNHNNNEAQFKHANETMAERAHLGSAAWAEAPTMLSDFMMGAGAGQNLPQYERVQASGMRSARRPISLVRD